MLGGLIEVAPTGNSIRKPGLVSALTGGSHVALCTFASGTRYKQINRVIYYLLVCEGMFSFWCSRGEISNTLIVKNAGSHIVDDANDIEAGRSIWRAP